jgi:CheY-like chemotaxis protein
MRDDAHEIILVSNRASALTRQLLAFSRQQVVEPQVVDLDGAIAGVGNMLRRLVGAAVDLRTERRAAGEQVLIRIDPGHLEQVLLNFVVNAKDAMPAGGTIVIATDIVSALPQRVLVGSTTPEPGPFVELSVRDSGVGMDSSTLEKIFEPFFTTKEPGKGTGLGLATVYGIVSQNGGRISVESTPGAGTTFSVYVPRARAADLSAPDHHDALPDGPGHGTILLVEDEEAVRAVARRVLVRAGYRVIDAAKASEALFQARQPGVRIDLLLTDLVMPGVSGERLYDELVAERPRLKVLFMSGYSEQRHVHAGRANFMQKPFSPDVLTARVRAVLHAGDEGA